MKVLMFAGRLLDDWMLGCGGFDAWMVRSEVPMVPG